MTHMLDPESTVAPVKPRRASVKAPAANPMVIPEAPHSKEAFKSREAVRQSVESSLVRLRKALKSKGIHSLDDLL